MLIRLVHIRAGPSGDDRKPRSSAGNGAYVNAMSEHSDGLPDDEEPDAEPLTLRGVEARKSFEYLRHMLIGNANSRVENIDAHAILEVPAAQQHPAAGFSVFDCIADQIAKRRTEQKSVTHNPGAGRHHPNLKPLLQRGQFVLPPGFSQQRLEIDRR